MRREARYYVLPDGSKIARIAKVASSSLAQAICKKFYPERVVRDFGDGAGWQYFCPSAVGDGGVVHVPVRDVLGRFKSAVVQVGVEVDVVLDSLEGDGRFTWDIHFMRQSEWVNDEAVLYDFMNLGALFDKFGLVGERVNGSEWGEVELSDEQVGRVMSYYEDDVKLKYGMIGF